MSRERLMPRPVTGVCGSPFATGEEAFFWFMQAWQARQDGAHFTANSACVLRPCEPLDVLQIVDRLHRQRMIQRDHLYVLSHYGRRLSPPDPRRYREQKAFGLWREAMERIEGVLRVKGIVQ